VTKKTFICVVGARPNLMKMAPIIHAMKKQSDKLNVLLVHTGQHYDYMMSEIFFRELELDKPDYFLGIGSGKHGEQTARIMIAFEEILEKETCDGVVVAGDVNSTIACSLVAVKMHIPVTHVESGLRSFDSGMPEEINRILTDRISSVLFVTEKSGRENLLREGVSEDKIFMVGNTMIDSLERFLSLSKQQPLPLDGKIESGNYILVTLHRPSNVDDKIVFLPLMKMLAEFSSQLPIVFPVHPRTKEKITEYCPEYLSEDYPDFHLIEPTGYLSFLNLMSSAKLVLTDSGGIQEETSVLNVPCLTLRENTERPVTIEVGTNELIGIDPVNIKPAVQAILQGKLKRGERPPMWDGKSAERIVKILMDIG
jgi:UDP-N-acetylglucosamine 2-epimerase (non-hydrolysing)